MRRRVYNPDRLKYPINESGRAVKANSSALAGKKPRHHRDQYAAPDQRVRQRIHLLNYGTGTLGGTMTRSWPPGKPWSRA